MGTRATFGMAILKLVHEVPDFYVLSADLCTSSGLERFRNKYPENFINVGIAEQNLIGVAGGLAKDGTPVFATSFAPFISMRASEQIRMNMGYMSLNVKAVGLGSGLAMTNLGASHYGLEDIAVMRTIPGMVVLSPADCTETVKCVEAAKNYDGPVYIRLTGGPGNPIVYKEDYEYQIGKANLLKKAGKIALIAEGTMVYQSLKASELLEERGIETTVIDMHTLKPLDTEILDSLEEYEFVFTVEEHNVIGGLGSAVAEYMIQKLKCPRQIIIGVEDIFPHAGSYEYLLKQCGLTSEQIAEKVIQIIK
jgi:transketolase